ncbi:MAG TPA: hypothetical protein VLD39_04055 [Gammaproteobacteria bacterium]|nr:hypothetical protein [Gammaproteobacteria bacterium]
MTQVIEHASSGRAKCRGCNAKIDKDALRFGERLPNAFGEGEATLWFHLSCAAYKRPEPFLELLDAGEAAAIPDDGRRAAAALVPVAKQGIEHRRLPRIDKVEQAPTGRARCRSCRELIDKGAWRIGLVFFEEYRFQPSGFIHATCAADYFGTTEIVDRMRHFNPQLSATDVEAVVAALRSPG